MMNVTKYFHRYNTAPWRNKHCTGQERTGLYRGQQTAAHGLVPAGRRAQVLGWHQVVLQVLPGQWQCHRAQSGPGLASSSIFPALQSCEIRITWNSNFEFQQVSLSGHFLFLLCRQGQWFPAQEFCSLHIALPVFLSDVGKIPNSALGELTCARNEPPEDKSAFPIELLRLYIDGMCSSGRENLTKLWLRISPGCLMAAQAAPGYKKGLIGARSCSAINSPPFCKAKFFGKGTDPYLEGDHHSVISTNIFRLPQ